MGGANLGWWVPVLVLVVPPLLLVLLHLLARIETWTLEADERAAAVVRLLEQEEGPDEVEAAVTSLLSGVARTSRRRRVDTAPPDRPVDRRRRLRAAVARAAARSRLARVEPRAVEHHPVETPSLMAGAERGSGERTT